MQKPKLGEKLEEGTEEETMEKCPLLNSFPWLTLFTFICSLGRHTCTTMMCSIVCCVLQYQLLIKKMPPIDVPTGQSEGVIFSIEVPCSQMTLVYVKLRENQP